MWKLLHQSGKAKPVHLFQGPKQWPGTARVQRNRCRKWKRDEQGTSSELVLAAQANQTKTSSVQSGTSTPGSSSFPLHLQERAFQNQTLVLLLCCCWCCSHGFLGCILLDLCKVWSQWPQPHTKGFPPPLQSHLFGSISLALFWNCANPLYHSHIWTKFMCLYILKYESK